MERLPDDELISAYLDDELSAEERARAEQLLVERPEARRLLDELRGVRESMQSLPSYRLEPDFNTSVLRRAEREVLRPAAGPTVAAKGDAYLDGARPGARWQRPLMWSLLAVGAAVALMFFDRRAADDRNLAQNKLAEPAANLELGDPAAARQPGEHDLKDLAERKGLDGFIRAEPLANPSPMAKETVATQPVADAPRAEGLLRDGAAGPPAANLGKIAAGGMPAGPNSRYLVTDPLPPPVAANPNVPPLNQFSVGNAGQAGGGGAMGGFGGLGQPSLAAQTDNAQIDTTPLVAAADFDRAVTLVNERRDGRLGATNEQETLRALENRGVRLQVADREAQIQQLVQKDRQLLVICDVASAEALERGLVPVLEQQQIADLTSLRSDNQLQSPLGLAVKQEEASRRTMARDADGEVAEEEYLYVVADGKKLEATLAALRDQPDFFFNVTVEPAPANERQQAWRGRYSRGGDVADSKVPAGSSSSPIAAKGGTAVAPSVTAAASSIAAPPAVAAPLPVTAPSPVAAPGSAPTAPSAPTSGSLPSATATSPVPAAPAAGEIAKKSAEGLGESKNQAPQAGKTGGAFSDERNSGVAKAGPDAQVAAAQQALTEQLGVNGTVQNGYWYAQNAVPMSRAQRLRSTDAQYAVENKLRFESRLGGEKAQDKPAEATATPAAPAVPAVAGRPQVTVPAKPDDATAKTKDEVGAAQAAQQRANVDKLAAEKPAYGNVAQTPAPTTLGYELPPDYHEALFIFRVVSPTERTKANAEGAPADAAKPQATGGAAPKSKAD